MSYDKVKQANQLMIGKKQTIKAITQGRAQEVVVATDADQQLVDQIISLCRSRGVAVLYVDSMKRLGQACGIEVKAATAAIVKD
ncbi:large subunit ribosomal protein L7A [Seinonella peptonophila]|uniref:Large subunit ribosomal protein L7A n=1 Tax=Seinonella peptonophila TaxID=112248 RepID=A0A1M4YV76_9BACL|nr:50S ribosomal protein L7ae-like protein [Seinonella peptonophila]SHF09598.1 large subunit ribosomal protein L7A [Seinonella peptonophila]